MLAFFRYLQANSVAFSKTVDSGYFARVGGIVLLLALTSCDAYPFPQQCRDSGGQYESRIRADGAAEPYCVYPDGTECGGEAFRNGSCELRETAAPTSPLITKPQPIVLSMAIALQTPKTLDELVKVAPLIVIGEIGAVQQYTFTDVYEGAGKMRAGIDPASAGGLDLLPLLMPNLPVTDFQIEVEEVLRGDGTVVADEPVILRMAGHVTKDLAQETQITDYPFSYTGDRYLFLLSPYPDGQTYGFYYGPWSRLIIDGDILRVSSGKQQPLQFGEDAPVTLEELAEIAKGEKRIAPKCPHPHPAQRKPAIDCWSRPSLPRWG